MQQQELDAEQKQIEQKRKELIQEKRQIEQQQKKAEQPTQQQIGWIWLGSVDNKSGTFNYGEALIPTKNQPVTITPSIVPSPNTVVTLKTSVNIRSNLPQPSNFKLSSKVGKPLPIGQEVIILRVEAFVDFNSDISNTRIWAKIKLP